MLRILLTLTLLLGLTLCGRTASAADPPVDSKAWGKVSTQGPPPPVAHRAAPPKADLAAAGRLQQAPPAASGALRAGPAISRAKPHDVTTALPPTEAQRESRRAAELAKLAAEGAAPAARPGSGRGPLLVRAAAGPTHTVGPAVPPTPEQKAKLAGLRAWEAPAAPKRPASNLR